MKKNRPEIEIDTGDYTNLKYGKNINREPSGRKASDHFDGKRFFNPTLPEKEPNSPLSGFKILLEKRAKWPASVKNRPFPVSFRPLSENEISITFINHATFLIRMAGLTILTDPVWSERVSPFRWMGPARVRKPGMSLKDLPEIDIILLSHNHYDHIDLDTLKILAGMFSPTVFAASGDRGLVESTGLKKVYEMDWWDCIKPDSESEIIFTPAQHFSGRSLSDRRKSLWGSYMIRHAGKSVYFGGDAGYSYHFKEIAAKIGAPDISLLGIGAYEPRWFMKAMHMNPEEAVMAHIDLKSKLSIGMHFGTFQLSTEGIDQPVADLCHALLRYDIPEEQFITLEAGESRIELIRSLR